ncbi:MAG: trypsin-like peptidase domain-containing protein [bacterium]|nr:trypsin-like peptidase domain-containing protein [bacterium]
MTHQRKSLAEYSAEYSVEELDRELIVRGAQIPEAKRFEFGDTMGSPTWDTIMRQVKGIYDAAISQSPNEALSHFSTEQLVKMLLFKTGRIDIDDLRGIWGKDDRQDFFQIEDEQVKENAGCVAAICYSNNFLNITDDLSMLKVKNYGKAFNLDSNELFHQQPIATGRLNTGFLVEEDIIATAAHCADEKNVTDLRFMFDFKMKAPSKPVTHVSNENIYKGVKIIRRVYNSRKGGDGSDWALVKLDRGVVGQRVAKLSKKEITLDQSVYIMGHPCGLPLKYGPGATVSDINKTCFGADLDVYCGSSGAPVFDSETHEVIGIVVRGDNRDFRWTGKGWVSVIYSRSAKCSNEPQCTRVSEFIDYLY